ncbi:MAG TPA: protein phosphatase CheZ [Steroidobacteraceae bacterium]|nr:protein phosphatase CheZ [Steroidobacteraceae bacterium]
MVDNERNLERLRPLLERLTAAVGADDAPEFERLLDDLVHARRKDLFAELRQLTSRVREALNSFQLNARFADLAEREVPDARQRLQHVLQLTDSAAHQTMDLIERCGPLVEVLATAGAQPLPAAARAAASQLRTNLSEVLLAQGYQDLTGQIVRGVIRLVDEVEATLSSLLRIVGETSACNGAEAPAVVNGYGPVVPGVDHGAAVSSQQDVDALLSELGL